MKDLFESWMDGLGCLIDDDLISFYTFFTLVLAEISYLFAFQPLEVAKPLSLIFFGYMLNVIICAVVKGNFEGTKLELICSIVYVLVFVALFIIGCIINWKITLICTIILFGITALWIAIRDHQDSVYAYKGQTTREKLALKINSLFRNKVFWIVSQIIVIGAPFIAFIVMFANISFIPTALKIIIPIVYVILAPVIAFFEDASACCTIFELAYEISWSKDKEEVE